MAAFLRIPDLAEIKNCARDVEKTFEPVDWYSSRNAIQSEEGFCGQDESALKHLHLPEKIYNVKFDLNRVHPQDDFKLYQYDEGENIGDFLSWIKQSEFSEER